MFSLLIQKPDHCKLIREFKFVEKENKQAGKSQGKNASDCNKLSPTVRVK